MWGGALDSLVYGRSLRNFRSQTPQRPLHHPPCRRARWTGGWLRQNGRLPMCLSVSKPTLTTRDSGVFGNGRLPNRNVEGAQKRKGSESAQPIEADPGAPPWLSKNERLPKLDRKRSKRTRPTRRGCAPPAAGNGTRPRRGTCSCDSRPSNETETSQPHSSTSLTTALSAAALHP